MKLLFPKPLIEGLIKSRPNRFIMHVVINEIIFKCHCPSTGKIGNLKFEDIPCLLSKSTNENRSTLYTVEAFSLDPITKLKKSWIGINQTKANAYMEFFLKNNQLKNIIEVNKLKRETKLVNSRIDFLLNDKDYLEVKMPLKDIDCSGHEKSFPVVHRLPSFARLVKHFDDISSVIETGSRAILVMCYAFDAKKFKVPVAGENVITIAAGKARNKGLENWQVNLKIDEEGVELRDYFKLFEEQ